MSISSVSNQYTDYYQAGNSNERKSQSTSNSTDKSFEQSVVVTLSDGSTQNQTLIGTPLAVAWAPQTFVQGDSNGDDALSLAEFQKQLARANVTVDDASRLFASFDQSGDGLVSIDEFVDGVNNSIKSGDDLFNQLVGSYIRDADGAVDSVTLNNFLGAGCAAAQAYW